MSNTAPSHIVAIGASAGGLEAIQLFLENTPADLGVAYVIIQHLSPDFKSMMDELLVKNTQMPVHPVKEGEKLEANTIYLIPAGKLMRIIEQTIYLSELPPDNRINLPINEFFRSLAEEQDNNAIGIILSGTGSDGSRGILALKEAGAIIMVQEPEEAQFDGMPINAINTGAVDFTCSVKDMPGHIQRFISHPLGSKKSDVLKSHLSENSKVLDSILSLIQNQTDLDFKAYKESTVARRIAHRMGIINQTTLANYYEYIKTHKDEVSLIKQDLLIGVTQFLRDNDVWQYVSTEIIEALLRKSKSNEPIRVWSTGCSTGEEPYTIAMLFLEAMEKLDLHREVKVFASDVDQTAVAYAANGLYPPSISSELPIELIEKYFSALPDGSFQVTKKLRSKVVFATHNLIQDPPFSNMDMISCRNTLIYLQNPAQQKAFAFFHFALKLGGILVLGSAESPGSFTSYFDVIESRHRIYRKVRDLRIPISGVAAKNIRTLSTHSTSIPQFLAQPPKLQPQSRTASLGKDKLMELYVPPTLIFNEKLQLVYSYGDTELFTNKIKPGHITNDIGDIFSSDVASLAISAAHQVMREKKTLTFNNSVRLKNASNINETWSLKAFEFYEREDVGPFVSISFIQHNQDTVKKGNKDIEYNVDEITERRLKELDKALIECQKLYREALEDLDTTSEELQSSNEELMAANEELQSTNEELQSVNEELYTVNSEHQQKILELTNSNNDLENLLKSSRLAVLFLDENLKIRRFTHALKSYINIIEFDIDREFTDITFKYKFDELNKMIAEVNNNGISILKTFEIKDGVYLEVSITPYLAKTKNAGVILSMRPIDPIITQDIADIEAGRNDN